MTPVGPFLLRSRLGVGGMAEVWDAVHRDREDPLAIKFLRRGAPANRRSVAAFWNEIRAMAVLDHPNILRLLDFGELSDAMLTPDGDLLAEGCPYLVLELARGGDLSRWVGQPRPWEELRDVLLALLDALAHAHARGVLHLDIKPANVLWCNAADARPGLKLGDFGIAHLWTGVDARGGSSGTPAFMAPEQIRGPPGGLGPWTDLYAVGLVAWALIHNELPPAPEPPVASRGLRTPHVSPRMSVPEDLYGWLERMLQQDPERRYRRAADAAWALSRISDGRMVLATPGAPRAFEDTLTVEFGGGTTWSAQHAGDPAPDAAGAEPPRSALFHAWLDAGLPAQLGDVPPIPAQGITAAGARPRALRGVGAALHGLAVPQLVGREIEQEQLWSALVETGDSGRARAIVVRGPAGFGKSRLLQWLAERSHEVGATEVLRAIHEPEGGRSDGVWSMAARALRLPDAEEAGSLTATLATLMAVPGLEQVDVPTVAHLLLGGGAPDAAAGPVRVTERFSHLSTLLAGLCKGRVGLIAIDDAQWGREAIEFVDFVLRRQDAEPVPLLFALSVQDEALVTSPTEAALLGALLTRTDVGSLEIGPLRVADWPRMVEAFLTLEPGLAEIIIEGTQGNPLFAAQLLDDWVARGVLVPTPAGYAATGQAALRVPDDLARFWAQRVSGALADRSPEEREAVELAAVLGAEVDPAEWRAVCASAGCAADPDLIAVLLERGLARAGAGGIGQGWAFSHGLLRQALLGEAAAGGRLSTHHARCAEGLAALPPGGRWIRIGRHFLAAGLSALALDPLGQGLDAHINHLAIAEARGVLTLLGRALDEASVPEIDLRRWSFRLHRCTVARRDIHSRASLEAELLDLEAQAHEQGWTRQFLAVQRDRAVLLHDLGRFHEAERVGAEALALTRATESEPTVALANILGSLAMIWLALGRIPESKDAYRAASEIYEAKGELFLAGAARAGLAEAYMQQERLDEADEMVALARAHAARSGSAHAAAEADALWGEVRRKRGDLPMAETLFRRAIQGFQALASSRECPPTVNLALVLLAQRRMDEARAMSERVLMLARAPGAGWLEVHGHVQLLTPCALVQDWAAWDEHIAAAEARCRRDPPADADLARWASEAVGVVETTGTAARVTRGARLAALLWRALGREAEAAAMEARASVDLAGPGTPLALMD